MVLFLADIVALAVLGVFVLRRSRDRRVGSIKSAHWLRIAGLVPLGLQVAFFLVFGIGEMASGDLSGAAHLLPVAAIALLGVLAWMRPLEGGIALLGVAVLFAVDFIISVVASGPPESAAISPAMLILAVPHIVSGALFFLAGMLARRPAPPARAEM